MSAATLNLIQFEVYAVNFDATCLQYLFFEGTVEYIYFYRNNNQFELWIVNNASNSYVIYTAPQQDVLVFKWPDLTINGLKMDLVFHKGKIRYTLSFTTETILCKINEISGGSSEDHHSVVDKPRVQSGKYTMLAAGLLCLLTLTAGIFVALITNFRRGPQAEGKNACFANTVMVYKHTS